MVAAQAHRGPDDHGTEFVQVGEATLGLGQTRLSIQDLSPLGHQPMVHPETGDMIVFNGEIYNFHELRDKLIALGVRFRGHSDTEVLLHALVQWGTDCLADLAGMYAFIFYQKRTRRLLLCRDPLGIKPLYVAETQEHGNSALVIASEVRAVLSSGLVERKVDRRGVAGLLAYGAVQEPFTFFERVRVFGPGCYQWYDLDERGGFRAGPVLHHWSFPAVDQSVGEAAAVEQLDTELTRAVKEHLIADVPVGVFLSSGLDSTIMAALARQVSPNVRTFTLGFLDQPDLSESDMARTSARDLHVEHHDIQVTSENALDLTMRWLHTLDQPSVDGLNTYIISKAVRDAGIIVAVSGLGGDELFGGYPSFHGVPKMHRWMRRLGWLQPQMRARLVSLLGTGREATIKDKLRAMGMVGPDLMRQYMLRRRLYLQKIPGDPRTRLARMGLHWGDLGLDDMYQDPSITSQMVMPEDDPVAAISRYESAFYMRNMLLRDTDATSMSHSLEIRVPFLDRRVLDIAYRIPGSVRLPSGHADKHLMRRAFGRFLRPELLNQAKRGFTLPIRRWMTTSLRDLCEASIANLKASEIVTPAEVDVTWNTFLAHPEERIWSSAFLLCTLGHYLEQASKIETPRAPLPTRVQSST